MVGSQGMNDGTGRRRHVVPAVGALAAVGTLAAGVVSMPAAYAKSDWFNGVQSPKVTLSSGAKKVVHMGVLGYGATSAIPLDTGVPSPGSITKTGSKLFQSPRLSYAVDRYVDTSGRYQAAAISWYLRRHAPDSHATDVQKAMNAIKSKDHAHYVRVLDDYKWISSTAKKWGGPYTMAPRMTVDGTSGGTVEGIGLKTRSDAWYAHKKITVTLHGPAQFAGGAVEKSAKTAHHGLSWAWTRTGEGEVSATVTATGLPPIKYRLYTSATKGRQRLMVPGPATSVSTTVKPAAPAQARSQSPTPSGSPSSPSQSPTGPQSSSPTAPSQSPSSPQSPTTSPTQSPTSPPSSQASTPPETQTGAAPASWFVVGDRHVTPAIGVLPVGLDRTAQEG